MANKEQSPPVTRPGKAQLARFVDDAYRGFVRFNDRGISAELGHLAYAEAAIFSLVIQADILDAQRWLADAAGCFLEKLLRKSNTSGMHYLRAVFRLSICGETKQLAQMNSAYVTTPAAIRGGRGTGGVTPHSDSHWWYFANVMSLYFTGSAEFDNGMEELVSLPPRKQWKHSGDWWRAMVALAVECLTASEPDPWSQLAAVAEVNQHMFRRWYLDNTYEAWLAEMAMSFIVAARDRGYTIPKEGPHPSTPFGLFHLPPRPIIVRPYDYPHDIDDELKAAITKAWKATRKKKRRRRKKAPK